MKRICTDIESSIIWQSQADILLNSVQYDVCSPVDLKFGDRILVVRCVNGAYFLMLLNERTKGLIPACPPEYFSEINWRDAARLLHPMEHILENDSTAMNEADKEVVMGRFQKVGKLRIRDMIAAFECGSGDGICNLP